jgi:hypothetical protein
LDREVVGRVEEILVWELTQCAEIGDLYDIDDVNVAESQKGWRDGGEVSQDKLREELQNKHSHFPNGDISFEVGQAVALERVARMVKQKVEGEEAKEEDDDEMNVEDTES